MYKDKPPEMSEARILTRQALTIKQAMQRARNQEPDQDPDPYGYLNELEDAQGLQLLPDAWKATPDSDLHVKRRMKRARREKVAGLWMRGRTVAEIARLVNVNEVTVYGDLGSIHEQWQETQLEAVEVQAARDLARIDFAVDKLWPKVTKGDVNAIGVLATLIDKRGKILGYGNGVQVDIEAYIRRVAEANGYDADEAVAVAARIKISL